MLDVVGHDVIFNLRKPALVIPETEPRPGMPEQEVRQLRTRIHQQLSSAEKVVADVLEHLVAETIRDHLRTLPDRIQKDPKTYSDEHRTTPFLNTMLMNTLIPKGVDVSRLNLPFIEQVCVRYFRKVDNRWFVRDVSVGNHIPNGDKAGLFQAPELEVAIQDETSAITWLRQRLAKTPLRIGELRPHWMRATVRLTSDISTRLEQFLSEHFWLDRHTRRWREPTEEERGLMDSSERQKARFDAERFLTGQLRQHPTDEEVLEWITHLYHSASLIEDEAAGLSDTGQADELPEEAVKLYGMMTRLFHGILKEKVDPSRYALAQRQCRIAATKVGAEGRRQQQAEATSEKEKQPTLFDFSDEP